MIVYRITKSNRASDISGAGASLYPGRWNKKGTPVLYTGESIEIALLENLVHIPPLMLPDLELLEIEIPNDSIKTISAADLPSKWYEYPPPAILSLFGQKWVDEDKKLGLKVPSSIIHTSNIIILNCSHKAYKSVRILNQSKFYFDTRLSK